MFKFKLLKHQSDVNDVVLVFLLLTYFTPFSSVAIVDFEQVNISWDNCQRCIKPEIVVDVYHNF